MDGTDNLVNAFVDAVNRNDAASIAAVLHDDFVDHTPNPGQSPGRDGFVIERSCSCAGRSRTSFHQLGRLG